MSEVREFYAEYEHPFCTNITSSPNNSISGTNGQCSQWLYDTDFNYQSMTIEVRLEFAFLSFNNTETTRNLAELGV